MAAARPSSPPVNRYKWLSQEAGRRFGGIYNLQAQGTAFSTPEDWLRQLDLFDFTQQQAAEFMQVRPACLRRIAPKSICFLAQSSVRQQSSRRCVI
jgi:hypothetical protein